MQDAEIKKVQQIAQDASLLAAEKSSKCSITMEVIKCISTEVFHIFPLNIHLFPIAKRNLFGVMSLWAQC